MEETDTRERLIPGLGWTRDESASYIQECFDRDRVLEVVLGYAREWMESRMILILGRTAVQPFLRSDWELSEIATTEEFRKIRAPLPADSPLFEEDEVAGSAADIGLGALFEKLGVDPNLGVVSCAIRIAGRPAILVIGLAEGHADTTSLQVVANAAGEHLETLIKLSKVDALPPKEERIPAWPPRILQEHNAEEARREEEERPELDFSPRDEEAQQEELAEQIEDAMSSIVADDQVDELEEGDFDLMEDEDEGSGGPRLASMVEEDDEAPDSITGENPNATMFGIPTFQPNMARDLESSSIEEEADGTHSGTPVHNLIEESASPFGVADSAASQASDPQDIHESVIDAPEPLAMPGPDFDFDDLMDDDDGRGRTERFDPAAHGIHPDDESEAELLEELADDSSEGGPLIAENADHRPSAALVEESLGADASEEVLVVPPKEIGDETSDPKKTLVGGMGAEVDFFGQTRTPADEGDPTEEVGNVASHAEMLFKAAEELARATGRYKALKNDEERRSTASVPQFGIIKTARTSRRLSSTEPQKGAVPQLEDKQPKKRETSRIDIEKLEEASTPRVTSRIETGELPEAKPRSTSRIETSGLEQGPSGADADSSAPPSLGQSSSHTMMGMDFAKLNQEVKESEEDSQVDDAWLDYFQPESSGGSEAVATDRSKAEEIESDLKPTLKPGELQRPPAGGPQTMSPEALERILDSGPIAIELQESYMIMDSRDREKAFEAAEYVAQSAGFAALEILSMMFPGRLFIDRYQYTPETLPDVQVHGPVMAALVRIGEGASEIARQKLEDTSIETRFYATFLFTQLPADKALLDLYPRLFDRDTQTRAVARSVIARSQSSLDFPEILRTLRQELVEAREEFRVEIAADLLARFRDREAIAFLIDTLGKHPGRTNQTIHNALMATTLHSWSSQYEWRQWWFEASEAPREEWILAALESTDEKVRNLVWDEIQKIPGLELDYHPDHPPALRSRAKEELSAWFEGQQPD